MKDKGAYKHAFHSYYCRARLILYIFETLYHQGNLKKKFSHFEFCQKSEFQWMKNSMKENPQKFPAFDPRESAMEPGVKSHAE